MLEKALERKPRRTARAMYFLLAWKGVKGYIIIRKDGRRRTRGFLCAGGAMKKGIFVTIVFLFLTQGSFTGWKGTPVPRDTAAAPALNVKSIHPLPEWEGPEDLGSRSARPEGGSKAERLKISFPVGLMAILLFFLMWKFLQGQE